MTSNVHVTAELWVQITGEVVEQKAALDRIRAWCDETEEAARAWLVEHNPNCECEVGPTQLADVAAVRALLPEVTL